MRRLYSTWELFLETWRKRQIQVLLLIVLNVLVLTVLYKDTFAGFTQSLPEGLEHLRKF